MPDWSYRTIFQPVLFSFPAETARGLALGAMGRLSRLPFGPTIIDLFGHMRPDTRLTQSIPGMTVLSPAGIGHFVDPHGMAPLAFARFGVGFIEVGPVSVKSLKGITSFELRVREKAIFVPEESDTDGLDIWLERLAQLGNRNSIRYFARLIVAKGTSSDQATSECREMQDKLADKLDGMILGTSDEALSANWPADEWQQHVRKIVEGSRISSTNNVWVAIRADLGDAELSEIVGRALAAGCRGVVIDGRITNQSGGWIVGQKTFDFVKATVQTLRSKFGDQLSLIAGSVHEPADAVTLRQDGADFLIIDSGLIFSGPGLPKRINEAVLYADDFKRRSEFANHRDTVKQQVIPLQRSTWFWSCLLGSMLLLGGLLALQIAVTRVILPYDEVFVGMSRDELHLINPKLLAFMQHDRVTLSGTMIALAILYLFLSWYGIRHGVHWAMVAVLASSFVGFASFFLFLGFGYFDPFHAFVTTIGFQLMLMAFQGELGQAEMTCPNLRETRAWRLAQWGQLLFVIHATALVCAGTIISGVGCSTVFVREDLEFMDVCPSDLSLANPRLIPLIAHDRASFGGMLISIGVATLMTSLWGFRESKRWQWWMLLLAGMPSYSIAIAVHLAVGYTNWWHLAPAYCGLLLLAIGLALLWPYLGRRSPELIAEWSRINQPQSHQ